MFQAVRTLKYAYINCVKLIDSYTRGLSKGSTFGPSDGFSLSMYEPMHSPGFSPFFMGGKLGVRPSSPSLRKRAIATVSVEIDERECDDNPISRGGGS